MSWTELTNEQLVARLIAQGLPTDRAWNLVLERDWDGPALAISVILGDDGPTRL